MQPVTSSQIESIGYVPEASQLYVKFKTGATYAYKGVSQEAFNEFLSAESVGSHFGKNIRGAFEYSKLGEEE